MDIKGFEGSSHGPIEVIAQHLSGQTFKNKNSEEKKKDISKIALQN
jgi:hypothetical protein